MSKSSYELMNAIIETIVNIEELEAWLSENPEDAGSKEHLSKLNEMLVQEFEGLESKADKFGFVLKKLEAEELHFKHMSSFFDKKATVRKNQYNKVKDRIKTVMDTLNLKELSGESFKLKLGKKSHSLEVDDLTDTQMETVPEKYKKTKTTINNSLLKEDLEKGIEYPFARIITKQNLLVK